MKTLIVQTDPVWGDRAANLLRLEGLLAGPAEAELIVLPEMFTTGYVVSPKGVAEVDGGSRTLDWMRSQAARTGAAVTGSVAVSEGSEKYYNRMFFVKPDGSYTKYDKRHLFSFAGEDRTYTAGGERVVVDWRGWRILLQVCYDLRFPVFARNRGDYDMIVYSANWPTVRIQAWNILLRARAIENLCYVVAANRVGDDASRVAHSGGSYLIDFKGKVLSAAEPDREQIVTATADLEALHSFRNKFPALADADRFVIL